LKRLDIGILQKLKPLQGPAGKPHPPAAAHDRSFSVVACMELRSGYQMR